MDNKILYLRGKSSNGDSPTFPSPSELKYGEIVINYLENLEAIGIKNADDAIAVFSPNNTIKGLESSINTHITYMIDGNEKLKDPHSLSKEQVGLGNVQNRTDYELDVSTAIVNALSSKISKSSVYNKLEKTEGVDTTKVALSAAMGKILDEAIFAQGGGLETTINNLSERIAVMEANVGITTT